MKSILFIGTLFSWLFGVTANHKHIISQSDIKYSTKGIVSSIINHKGYYHCEIDYPNDIDNLVFCSDGTFLENININCDADGNKTFGYINYGVYQIDKDTIRANYYEVYSYLKIWHLTKMKYLVLDNSHIMCISKVFISPKRKDPNDTVFVNKVYTFIPDNSLPEPNSPWIGYDWLWEDSINFGDRESRGLQSHGDYDHFSS